MKLITLCFIPCCESKRPAITAKPIRDPWYHYLGINVSSLIRGRQEMVDSLIKSSIPTNAIDLYTGNFYRPLDKEIIKNQIDAGKIRLFIISAGYGLVDANEQIHNYDETMTSRTARIWRDIGLVNIIAEVIQIFKADQVFGFFSGNPVWNYSGSKYRFFFSEGLKTALANGYDPINAGCFYRAAGKGQSTIPTALGKCFMDALRADYSKDLLNKMHKNDLPYSQELPITIKYESFVRWV